MAETESKVDVRNERLVADAQQESDGAQVGYTIQETKESYDSPRRSKDQGARLGTPMIKASEERCAEASMRC